MTTEMTTTAGVMDTESTLGGAVELVTITLVSPTGEETVEVPRAIALDDALLRGVLGEHGISMAATALIERASDGSIKFTKQADRNG